MDRGAIRFVLGGAHIMCPGLTSPGGKMEEELPADTPVVGSWRGRGRGRGMGCDESGMWRWLPLVLSRHGHLYKHI